jgi:hypothetical protein
MKGPNSVFDFRPSICDRLAACGDPRRGHDRSQLDGVEPNDPVSLGAAVLALLLVAVVAAWIPARRAARVDPMMALRRE